MEPTHLTPSLSPSPMISNLFSGSSFSASLHTNFVKKTPNLDLTLSTSLKLPPQRSTTYQTVFSHLVRPCLRVREPKKVALVCVSA